MRDNEQQVEKRGATGCPMTMEAVKDRSAQVKAAPEIQRRTLFEDLAIDLVAAIAHGVADPQEQAREFLRLGAEIFDDPEMWLTWEDRVNA